MPPQENIEQPGGIGEGLSGIKNAGASAIALSLLEQLTQSLGQVAHNPVLAGYAFGRIGRAIQNHLVKNLRESYSLTQAQTLALDQFSQKTTRWMQLFSSLGAGVASFGLKTAQSTAEFRKLGLELERYSTKYSGFGGTTSPQEAAGYLRSRRRDAMGEFTTEFAMSEEEMRKWLHQKMPKGTPIEEEEAIVRRLSTYQEGLQLRTLRPMLEHFFSRQATYGMDITDTTRLVDQLMTGYREGKFGQLHPDEVISTFQNMFMRLVDSGMAPVLARAQALTTMETVGGATSSSIDPLTGRVRNLPWGTDESVKVMDFISRIQGGQAGFVYESLLRKNVPQGEDAPVQIIKDLREYIARYMGKTPDTLFQLLRDNPEIWGQVFKVGESAFGLDANSIRLLMGSELPTSQMSLAKDLTDATSKSILDVNKATEDYVKHLQNQITSTRRLGDSWNAIVDLSQEWLAENAPAALTTLDIASGLVGIASSTLPYVIGWRMMRGKLGPLAPLSKRGDGVPKTGGLIVDKYGKPITSTTSPGTTGAGKTGLFTSTGRVSRFLPSKDLIGGAGATSLIAGGMETYNSLERGEDTGEAIGRGAVTTGTTLGGSIVGGMLLGGKLGAFGGPLGMLIGSGLGMLAGGLLGDVLFGDKGEEQEKDLSSTDTIPKVHIIITDEQGQLLSSKVVSTDGSDAIRVGLIRDMAAGVIRG